jgi:hypothetical protein
MDVMYASNAGAFTCLPGGERELREKPKYPTTVDQ